MMHKDIQDIAKYADGNLEYSETVLSGQETDNLAIARSVSKIDRQLKRGRGIRVNVVATCAPLGLLVALLASYHVCLSDETISISVILILMSLFIGHLIGLKIQLDAAGQLFHYTGSKTLGPLVNVLEIRHKQTRQAAEAALCHLLPHLQATDTHLLDKLQRERLNHALSGRNTALILAILKSFEQIGDQSALPCVEKLAAGKSRAATNQQIREAARACLPFLKERQIEHNAEQTLLRSTIARPSAFDILVRPASGANETSPVQLLRPDETDNGTFVVRQPSQRMDGGQR